MTLEDHDAKIIAAMNDQDWATVDRLAFDLDLTESTNHNRPALLPSALWYAAQGLHVFPLTPGAKHPLERSHGCKDATTNIDQIRSWWTRIPNANIGIATGHLVDIIDIDGPEGVHTWAQLDDLPPTLGTVDTPRPGGTHLYVEATGDRNAAGLFPGIDYRGAGGYVVAPPSRLVAGGHGVKHPGTYTWRRPLTLAASEAAA